MAHNLLGNSWCPEWWEKLSEAICGAVVRDNRLMFEGQNAVDDDDLKSEARIAAMKSFRRFDRRKSQPSTFIYFVAKRRLQTYARQVRGRKVKDAMYAEKSGVASVLLDKVVLSSRIHVFAPPCE